MKTPFDKEIEELTKKRDEYIKNKIKEQENCEHDWETKNAAFYYDVIAKCRKCGKDDAW